MNTVSINELGIEKDGVSWYKISVHVFRFPFYRCLHKYFKQQLIINNYNLGIIYCLEHLKLSYSKN